MKGDNRNEPGAKSCRSWFGFGIYREVKEMSMVISAASMMKSAYAGNVYFRDESYRKGSSNHDVVSADRKAMVRALERLEELDFESKEADDTKSIYHTVTSYLDIYNNTVSSASASNSSNIRRTGKEIRALMKEHKDSLDEIGIQFKSDGTVKIDKTKLKKATTSQVAKIFGDDGYLSDMKKLMKKLRNQVNRETPGQEAQKMTAKEDSLSSETVGNNLNLYA